jgi:hypothetical protein
MSRWRIEKDGTGIEKSGTGVEKSGTGIEKSGTGIEKSGTGIEKSGTGWKRGIFALSIAAMTFVSSVQAGNVNPAGSLQLVVNNNSVAVSWIIDGSVFSGVSSLSGSFASLLLTEISISDENFNLDIAGGGTGSSKNIAGGGTGSSKNIAGGGTGSSKNIAGGGTGSSKNIAGGGTGSSKNIAGGGTGLSVEIAGGGTGSSIDIAGGGTGSSIEIAGGGTGGEAILVTLPEGTGLAMEVSVGCASASVSVLDSSSLQVVAFNNVPVIGDTGMCGGAGGGFGDGFLGDPGRDFQAN